MFLGVRSNLLFKVTVAALYSICLFIHSCDSKHELSHIHLSLCLEPSLFAEMPRTKALLSWSLDPHTTFMLLLLMEKRIARLAKSDPLQLLKIMRKTTAMMMDDDHNDDDDDEPFVGGLMSF